MMILILSTCLNYWISHKLQCPRLNFIIKRDEIRIVTYQTSDTRRYAVVYDNDSS